MADALVFGRPNSLAGKLADGVCDALRVPVRYQQSLEQLARPGVAICTTLEALTTEAPFLVFADGELKDGKGVDEERVAWLGLAARALAEGRPLVTIHDREQARDWLREFKREHVVPSRPLRRVYIVGESGSGKTTLGDGVAAAFGLPVTHLDEIFVENPRAGHERWEAAIRDAASASDGWVIEGTYWRAAGILAPQADVTIYMDLPSHVTRKRRADRPPGPPMTFRYRVLHTLWITTYPAFESRVLRRELFHAAGDRPVLRVRNEAEAEAVRAGLVGK